MYINVQETYMYCGGLASNGMELSISACIYIELNGPWQCRDMAMSIDDLISRYIFKEWVNLIQMISLAPFVTWCSIQQGIMLQEMYNIPFSSKVFGQFVPPFIVSIKLLFWSTHWKQFFSHLTDVMIIHGLISIKIN